MAYTVLVCANREIGCYGAMTKTTPMREVEGDMVLLKEEVEVVLPEEGDDEGSEMEGERG